MRLNCDVNGQKLAADIEWKGESLLYVLQERFELRGSKNACEQGECGSCTVLLNNKPTCSCLVPALQAEGCEITTVEGLADEASLAPIQQALIESGGVQCGFCTPGFVVAAYGLLQQESAPSTPQIREALAGNICRCTGYEKIIDAVHRAAELNSAGAAG